MYLERINLVGMHIHSNCYKITFLPVHPDRAVIWLSMFSFWLSIAPFFERLSLMVEIYSKTCKTC